MAAVAELAAPDGRARSGRLALADGARTTVHVACHDAARTEVRVAVLPAPQRLEAWCAARGVREALVGGFFTRPSGTPLGEIRTHGVARAHVPFVAPWDRSRACVHVEGGRPQIVPRDELPRRPRGDLLQAGPLLVADGERTCFAGGDPEGFAAASRQFDSDITAGPAPAGGARARREPARSPWRATAARADDAGLTLDELAAADGRARLRATR